MIQHAHKVAMVSAACTTAPAVTIAVTQRRAVAGAVSDGQVPAAEIPVALVATVQTVRYGVAATTPPPAIPSPVIATVAQPRAGTDHSAKSVSTIQLNSTWCWVSTNREQQQV